MEVLHTIASLIIILAFVILVIGLSYEKVSNYIIYKKRNITEKSLAEQEKILKDKLNITNFNDGHNIVFLHKPIEDIKVSIKGYYYDTEDNEVLYHIESKSWDLWVYGRTMKEAFQAFEMYIVSIVRNYLDEPDENLTEDAIQFKNYLKQVVHSYY